MIKRVKQLLIIGRKLGSSGVIDIINQIYAVPSILKFIFFLFSIGSDKKKFSNKKRPGEKLCEAFQDMGTTFIKLGQFLATRPDIIGEELSNDLEKLQDKLPPFDMITAKLIIKKELGEKQFSSIENLSEPIAAASIAQVHLAKIKHEGKTKDVAIKILRPEIEKKFNEELDALSFISYLIESFVKKTKRLKLVEVVHLLREITNLEMDLRFEAAAANELYEKNKFEKKIQIPQIYWNYTTKRVLTLDKVDGVSIKDEKTLISQGVDLKKLAENLIQIFLKQAVNDGFFHADMHQGNLFVNKSGQLIPVDFGIMGRLDKNNRKYLAEILYGFIMRDYVKVAEVHFKAGLVPATESKDEFAQALRSVGEPIFGQTIKDISGANLLAQLFDITEKFNMATQPQLLLLQKTMVVVEGVARKLNPNTNIWEVSRPVLEDWINSTKGVKAKVEDAISTSNEIISKIPDLPETMERASYALKLISEGKMSIVFNNNSIENEKNRIKSFRNNIIITFFGVVILSLIVF